MFGIAAAFEEAVRQVILLPGYTTNCAIWSAGSRSNMPNASGLGLAAACAAAAQKNRQKTPSAATRKGYERAAAAAEKKAVAAEAAEERAKEAGLGVDAATAAATTARERASSARAKLAAAVPSERHAANGRLGSAAKMSGSVKHVTPTPADLVACAEAERMLTVEEVALRKMRAQKHGWVCALWVQEQLHVFLARDLEGVAGGRTEGWIEKVVAGGGKEREALCAAGARTRASRPASRPTRACSRSRGWSRWRWWRGWWRGRWRTRWRRS